VGLLLALPAGADQSGLAAADAFLRRHGADQAIRELSVAEKSALARALTLPGRTLDDEVISRLVKNPVAWRPGPDGRELLRSIIQSLPYVATVPGAGRSLANACHPNESNFRGFGFETIATAALLRYREPNGDVPRMLRMSADIRGRDGRLYESDGCAMFCGVDRRQRLVSMKSVSSPKSLRRTVKKAAQQLYLRNGEPNATGERQPGILMLGYTDPAVLEAALRKDWQLAAERSGARLLVLAVHQLSGDVTRVASVGPTAATVPGRPPRQGPSLPAERSRQRPRANESGMRSTASLGRP
jgi:hypothetical protein